MLTTNAWICSAVDEGKCIRENVVGGQRPSDIEEVDERTAIFLYNTQSQDLAGIFTGDDDPPALKNPALKKGPFMYQVMIHEAISLFRMGPAMTLYRRLDSNACRCLQNMLFKLRLFIHRFR